MSFFDNVFDNVRQTLEKTAKGAATRAGEAANTAREVGQNLSAQAQAQLQIKKLQLERSNKMRDLGEKTFAWYQSGTMIVAGPAPEDVHLLLRELDESSTRLRLEEAKLDDARHQAEMRGKGHESATYSVLPDANTSTIVTNHTTSTDNFNTENAMNTMTNQQSTPKAEKSTQKLSAFAVQAEGGVTMPGTGIITNPTPPIPNDDAPNAIPNAPAGDTSSSPIPDVDAPVPSPAPDGSGGLGGGTGVGIGTGIGTPGSIPGGTF